MAVGGWRYAGRRGRRGDAVAVAVEGLERRQLFCAPHHLTQDALDASFTRPPTPTDLLAPGGPGIDGSNFSLEAVGATPGQMNGNSIFGGGIYGAAAASYSARPDGLPLLTSRPGAPFTVFLDFDGWSGDGFSGPENWQPYDSDGNLAAFNATEATAIAEGWRRIASYMSPFDVNVTTVQPANLNDTTDNWSWSIISNNVSGGYSYLQLGGPRPSAFNQDSDLLGRTSGIMHELGHNFSLQHQSIYDANGVKTLEYRGKLDATHGVIMGVDFDGFPSKWIYGHPATSSSGVQDDVAIIANKIKPYQPAGGDGFRVDDYGGTLPSAFTLTPGAFGLHTTFGVVERLNDADAFRIASSGGWYTLSVIPDSPSGLDGKLEVYDANGSLLALSDAQAKIDTAVTLHLPAGDYYGVVKSHGNYGDIGAYEFRAAPTNPVNGPATNALPAPAGVTTTLAGGTGVTVSWSPVAGAANYVVERSLDGVAFTAASTVAGSATSYTDANLAGSHRYTYRVRAKDATGFGAASDHSTITNRPSGVTGVRHTQTSGTFIVLDWLERPESGGETGYRVERSTDGVNFGTVGSVGANVVIHRDNGVTLGQTYYYRIIPTSPHGDGPAAATGPITARLPAVSGLRVSGRTTGSVSLSWNDMANESGYRVERSLDGTSWSTLANLGAGVRTYNDTGLIAAGEYYYRVSGTASNGNAGVLATPVFSATLPTTGMPSPWNGADIGGVSTGGGGATALNPATGAIRLVSGGGDVGGTDDQFRYTYRSFTGDGTIVARVTSVENTNNAARVGVMFRESTATGSRVAFVAITANNGAIFTTRTATDASTSTSTASTIGGVKPAAPYWVKLQRVGNVFTAFASVDGNAWTQIGSPVTITMPATALAGFAGASRDTTKLNTSNLSDVDVRPPNAAPVANNDTLATLEDTPGAAAVLGNDSDGNGDPLAITHVSAPAHGTAVLNADRTITYTPAADYHGPDSFTYTVADGYGGTAAASVTVNVTPVNDAPTLAPVSDQAASVGEGTLSVLLTGLGTGAANESQTLTISAASDDTAVVPDPTVTDNGDGTALLSYTPTAQGTATITITVHDDGGTANGGADTFTRTFQITVEGGTTLPAWLAPGSAATWDANTKALTVTGAAAIIADPGADAPVITANGTAAVLTINPAGATSHVNVASLTLTGGATAALTDAAAGRVLVLQSGGANITGTGSALDLADNAMVVKGGTLAGVGSLLTTGFEGDTWAGGGIRSSTAAADANTALGYATAGQLGVTSFRGVAGLALEDVVVLYTVYGDANLSGDVTLADVNLAKANLGGTGDTWATGDFNYDGTTSIADLNAAKARFGQGVPAPSVPAPSGGSGLLQGEEDERLASTLTDI